MTNERAESTSAQAKNAELLSTQTPALAQAIEQVRDPVERERLTRKWAQTVREMLVAKPWLRPHVHDPEGDEDSEVGLGPDSPPAASQRR